MSPFFFANLSAVSAIAATRCTTWVTSFGKGARSLAPTACIPWCPPPFEAAGRWFFAGTGRAWIPMPPREGFSIEPRRRRPQANAKARYPCAPGSRSGDLLEGSARRIARPRRRLPSSSTFGCGVGQAIVNVSPFPVAGPWLIKCDEANGTSRASLSRSVRATRPRLRAPHLLKCARGLFRDRV
jgi:hypothetical protein